MADQSTTPNIRAQVASFAVVRSAVLTGDDLIDAYSRGVNHAAASLESDLKPLLDEAMRLSARGFLRTEAEDQSRASARELRAEFRYLVRMAARPTPLGLMASLGYGSVGGDQPVHLKPLRACRRHTRPDGEALAGFLLRRVRSAGPQRVGVVRPNGLAHRYGARWHCVLAGFRSKNGVPTLDLFEHSIELQTVLDHAHGGATKAELESILKATDPDVDWAEFISELMDSGLLLPDWPTGMLADDPLQALADVGRIWPSSELVGDADRISTLCRAIDRGGLGLSSEHYRELVGVLTTPDAPRPLSRTVQVDLVRSPIDGLACSQRDADAIARVVERLWPVTPAPGRALEAFAREFVRRFGEDLVPFSEAADAERGVGWALDERPGPNPLTLSRKVQLSSMIAGARDETDLAWHPSEPELRRLSVTRQSPPHRLLALFVPRRGSPTGRDEVRGLLERAVGPDGTAVYARFLPYLPELTGLVRSWLGTSTMTPDVALEADIVFLPSMRLANIVAHPPLSPVAICLDASISREGTTCVGISDLMLTVRAGRLELWSRSIGRRLLPRLRNAHVFDTPAMPSEYRLLSLLAYDKTDAGVYWSWSELESTADFLPRVVIDDVAVSRALWRVPTSRSDQKVRDWGRTLHERTGVRWLQVGFADRWTPIDLAAKEGTELLAHEVRRRNVRVVKELYPTPEEFGARSDRGWHNAEIGIPLTVAPVAPIRKEPDVLRHWASTPRADWPQSRRWLSMHIYIGSSLQDEFISGPLAAATAPNADAPFFFFIRYRDPAPHLRLRVSIQNGWTRARILGWVDEAIASVAGDLSFRHAEVAYLPERWRYGGPHLVGAAEDVFCADSRRVARALGSTIERAETADRVSQLCALHAETLMAWLGSPVEVERWIERSLGASPDVRRRARDLGTQVHLAAYDYFCAATSGDALPTERALAVKRLAAGVRVTEHAPLLTAHENDILASVLHMTANRQLFPPSGANEGVALAIVQRAARRAIFEAKPRGVSEGT